MVMDVGLSETAGSALDGLVGDTEVLKECERIRRGETAEDLVVVSESEVDLQCTIILNASYPHSLPWQLNLVDNKN